MAKINVLEKHIAELIAAGEVVERPSSVVKELTENAIDAGATSVTVEIKNGGVTYIRVTDNGCGMVREDVPLAFLRHATSKIAVQDDLDAIDTLGFRGEALASICAMARVELLTRTDDELAGTRYCIEGGDEQQMEDAGCPRGTTVIVRDLFFNTPARMKFLKKDVSEGNAVAGVVDKVALSHPEVAVRLIRDGKEVLNTPGDGRLKSAVTAVHGREFMAGLMPVSYRMGAMTVEGFVTKPAAARASRNMQTFFVNGRFVKSQTASAAVEQACRGAVMAGKFPACVLHIRIPSEAVDVNVHPAKIEVRFMTERPVFDVVYRAICDALSKSDIPKELQMKAPGGMMYTDVSAKTAAVQLKMPVRDSGADRPSEAQPVRKNPLLPQNSNDYIIETPVLRRSMKPETPLRKPEKPVISFPEPVVAEETGLPPITLKKAAPATPKTDAAQQQAHEAKNGLHEKIHRPLVVPEDQTGGKATAVIPQKTGYAVEPVAAAVEDRSANTEKTITSDQKTTAEQMRTPKQEPEMPQQQTFLPSAEQKPRLRFAGELFSTYMMLEAPDEVIFIDKHAAHERILFEKLKRDARTQFAQQLLTPVTFRPAREEYSVLLEHQTALKNAGFEIEEFGGGALVVRSAPMAFGETDVCAALTEIAAHLLSHRTDLMTAHEEWILHNIACRAAIKAGDKSDPAELLALAQQLYEHPELRYCPHGRPIYLSMKRRELEKQFGRIQ